MNRSPKLTPENFPARTINPGVHAKAANRSPIGIARPPDVENVSNFHRAKHYDSRSEQQHPWRAYRGLLRHDFSSHRVASRKPLVSHGNLLDSGHRSTRAFSPGRKGKKVDPPFFRPLA